VELDAKLGTKTSFGSGGDCDAFAVVNGVEELKKILLFASENNCEYAFFGCGTKTIVRDGGFGGIVIALGEGFSDIKAEETGDDVFVSAGAKVQIRDFISVCSEKGYSGAEWLSSFGGTVGGCVVSQVSKISNSMSGIIEEITVAMKDGREVTLKGKGLRGDETKMRVPRTAATTKVVFKLNKKSPDEVRAEVEKEMKDVSTDECFGFIRNVFENAGKVLAVECIEDAGFNGVRVGGARISRNNANCIVNEGKARVNDVLVLMEMIKDRVKQGQGVQLEPGITFIGEKRR
jgi:UDP-N-acetylmuramate dehydrogenase